MGRPTRWVGLLCIALVAMLGHGREASACTRLHVPLQKRLDRFDDVFVGTATTGGADTIFRVEHSRVDPGKSYLVIGSSGRTEATFLRAPKIETPLLSSVKAYNAAKGTNEQAKVLVEWARALTAFGGGALSTIADSPALIDALMPAMLDDLVRLFSSHRAKVPYTHLVRMESQDISWQFAADNCRRGP